MRIGLLLTALVCISCGAGLIPPAPLSGGDRQIGDEATTAYELRHQIMATYFDDAQVFEGYMVRQGDGFLVRAFAGPGVNLFTVARSGESHGEEAHLPGLDGRLDLEAVGMDIARAFLGGCEQPLQEGVAECLLLGQPMVETYDSDGKLVSRFFPKAYEGGLQVDYRRHVKQLGKWWPEEIELVFGQSGNGMVIRLVSVRETEPVDLNDFLKVD